MPAVTLPGRSPSGFPMAICRVADLHVDEVAEGRGGQAGRVDAHQGQVGQGVDALERALDGPSSSRNTVDRSAIADDAGGW